jgi:taurine dioxygenase
MTTEAVVPDNQGAFAHFSMRPMTVRIGAQISAVDVANLDDETFADLRRAALDFKVIAIGGQHSLTTEQFIEFGKRFGTLAENPRILPKQAENPYLSIIETGPDRPPYIDYWHTDDPMWEQPPSFSILRSEILPEVGGDTLWADMEAVYDDLDDDTRGRIDGLSASYDMRALVNYGANRQNVEKAAASSEPVEHPLVSVHPETGRRAVYFGQQCATHIVGVGPEESCQLMEMLKQLPTKPDYQVRLRWEPGTIVIWDNRSVQHYAVADYFPARRRMVRLTVH